MLRELDGSLSKLRFAAFQLLPYKPQDLKAVPLTIILEMMQKISHTVQATILTLKMKRNYE